MIVCVNKCHLFNLVFTLYCCCCCCCCYYCCLMLYLRVFCVHMSLLLLWLLLLSSREKIKLNKKLIINDPSLASSDPLPPTPSTPSTPHPRVPVAVGQPHLLAGGRRGPGRGGQLSRTLQRIHEPSRRHVPVVVVVVATAVAHASSFIHSFNSGSAASSLTHPCCCACVCVCVRVRVRARDGDCGFCVFLVPDRDGKGGPQLYGGRLVRAVPALRGRLPL